MKTYAVSTASPPLDASKALVEAVAISCLMYALASPAIYLIQAYAAWRWYPKLTAVFWMVLLLVAPAGLALLWAQLRKSSRLLRFFPHPTGKAWDYVFSSRQHFYVIITLRSGRRIAGAYGSKSFTSSGHYEEQIYIEEVWDVDEDQSFTERRAHTRGMLLSHSVVESIEFIGVHNDQGPTPIATQSES